MYPVIETVFSLGKKEGEEVLRLCFHLIMFKKVLLVQKEGV